MRKSGGTTFNKRRDSRGSIDFARCSIDSATSPRFTVNQGSSAMMLDHNGSSIQCKNNMTEEEKENLEKKYPFKANVRPEQDSQNG